jgi:hypothetical protein
VKTCRVDGCDRPAKIKQLCGPHYRQYRDDTADPCIIEGCTNPGTGGRGLCKRCAARVARHGDPFTVKRPRKPSPKPEGSMRGQWDQWRLTGPEHPVALPGVQPVLCPDCGRVVSATPDPALIPAARAVHARYCQRPT